MAISVMVNFLLCTAAARLLFFYRSIQLSTTDIFLPILKKNVVLLSTTSEKPKIWETRNTVLNSSVFSIFSAKIISST